MPFATISNISNQQILQATEISDISEDSAH